MCVKDRLTGCTSAILHLCELVGVAGVRGMLVTFPWVLYCLFVLVFRHLLLLSSTFLRHCFVYSLGMGASK